MGDETEAMCATDRSGGEVSGGGLPGHIGHADEHACRSVRVVLPRASTLPRIVQPRARRAGHSHCHDSCENKCCHASAVYYSEAVIYCTQSQGAVFQFHFIILFSKTKKHSGGGWRIVENLCASSSRVPANTIDECMLTAMMRGERCGGTRKNHGPDFHVVHVKHPMPWTNVPAFAHPRIRIAHAWVATVGKIHVSECLLFGQRTSRKSHKKSEMEKTCMQNRNYLYEYHE